MWTNLEDEYQVVAIEGEPKNPGERTHSITVQMKNCKERNHCITVMMKNCKMTNGQVKRVVLKKTGILDDR